MSDDKPEFGYGAGGRRGAGLQEALDRCGGGRAGGVAPAGERHDGHGATLLGGDVTHNVAESPTARRRPSWAETIRRPPV
ncbi:hypothetical protein [Nonomuraea sp. B19D2]|uniref:hypothetical protein n=1 Tax=Nonomuraea sp. B19D2 TaxID=3159561 RepID=UPI0032D9B799